MEYVWVLAIALDPWSSHDAMTSAAILDFQLTVFWRTLCVDAFRRQSTASSEPQRAKVMHWYKCGYVIVFTAKVTPPSRILVQLQRPWNMQNCKSPPAFVVPWKVQSGKIAGQLWWSCVLSNLLGLRPDLFIGIVTECTTCSSCTPVRSRTNSEAPGGLRRHPRPHFG